MIRTFVGFSEAAALLGCSVAGLCQELELGLGQKLPAYVYAGSLPFLARPIGPGVEFSSVVVENELSEATTLPGIGTLTSRGLEGWDTMGDKLGAISPSGLQQLTTGVPCTFKLNGYFRVAPSALMNAAKEGTVVMVHVAPESWWAFDSAIPKEEGDEPAVKLMLLPTDAPRFRELPELCDLQFKISDLEALKATTEPPGENSDAQPLDERERASLLHIIRALEVMAKLLSGALRLPLKRSCNNLDFASQVKRPSAK